MIGDSLASDRCEVLFTFVWEPVNRFLTHPGEKVRFSFEGLFGTGNYRQAARRAGDRRNGFAEICISSSCVKQLGSDLQHPLSSAI